jgi:creatinine amidohydrolase
MAIRELAEMTWEEVRDLARGKAVAILPVGAVEAHGPHLPLGTDVIIAQAMARSGAARIEAQGMPAVILPPVSFTAAFLRGSGPFRWRPRP